VPARVRDQTVRSALLDAYREHPAEPDAASCLRSFRSHGLRTAVLSNGSEAAIESALEHAGLATLVDDVLSVGRVGAFKPDRRVCRLAVETLDVVPAAIAFQTATRGTPPAPLRLDCWCTGSIVAGPRQAWRFISGQEPRSPMVGLGWKSLGVLELTALPSLDEERWVPLLRDTDVLLVDGGDAAYLFSS
jgi:haloacid dehalogenase-like hydrolase